MALVKNVQSRQIIISTQIINPMLDRSDDNVSNYTYFLRHWSVMYIDIIDINYSYTL